MPEVSVIMPVYNVERFVGSALQSVLAQTFGDFEVLVVDDQSPDHSIDVVRGFDDPRVRIVRHTRNRGLAGARNTGIRHARGRLLAFLDADDLWHPEKLARHVLHLRQRPTVGVSFSRSAFIDEDGRANRCFQMPRLHDIDAGYLLCRNPVGNGSAPVIRSEVFEAIAFAGPADAAEPWYFDERLRRSEDIECWVRIMLTTSWQVEGIPEPLTYYRLNAGGLSANLFRQLESWEAALAGTRDYAPAFVDAWASLARAYQLRYLARQAIRLHDGRAAVGLVLRALAASPSILVREPGRSLTTVAAALLLHVSPLVLYPSLESFARRVIGRVQARRITRDLDSQSA